MARRLLWALILALVGGAAAGARVLWIPVSGPMYHKGRHHYVTVRAPLTSADGKAAGTVRLDGNGGDDADRLIVKASGLEPRAACRVWFSNEKKQARMGQPLEIGADDEGNLRFTVYGQFCDLQHYPDLIVVVRDKVVLHADLAHPSPSAAPGAPPSPSAGETPAPGGTPSPPAPGGTPAPGTPSP